MTLLVTYLKVGYIDQLTVLVLGQHSDHRWPATLEFVPSTHDLTLFGVQVAVWLKPSTGTKTGNNYYSKG